MDNDSTKFRIAVATSDGIVVNQHFGRADRFVIIDMEEDGTKEVVEDRYVPPVCEGGNHDELKLKDTIDRLSDCQYLLVSRIGPGAESVLEQRNIGVFEIPGMMEEAIKKVSSYLKIKRLLM